MQPHLHPAAEAGPTPEDLPGGPACASAGSSEDRFNLLLPRVVAQVVGEGEPAREALRTGGFLVGESTVVMRLNPETDSLEFFCDIGLPLPWARESTLRAAMEMNLCRTHPGVTFGLHPESGRLVATTAMHMLLVADDEVCLNALALLTGVARQRREDGTFRVTVD
ncbi:type III secretion system chaperone [Ramlibacter sp. MAHUQ-53]|uniref:type III secretion system chaperone n=1 Tax=unclassified Ramlibacter TaxID=2617605 RepID=UPI003633E6DF